MRIYVTGDKSDADRVKMVCRVLQKKQKENSFICPFSTFSHLLDYDLSVEELLECRLDWLSASDKLIVVSRKSSAVQKEMEFALMVGMEVEHIEP